MSDSVRHPNWTLVAMAALPASQGDKPDLPTNREDIDDLIVAHARLVAERRNERALDIEPGEFGKGARPAS